jgi:biotin carboxyl carrier protein
MHKYSIVVNGNTYNVTVKSITGNKALVDVDGMEFDVGISEGDGGKASIVSAAGAVSAKAIAETAPAPAPKVAPKTDPKPQPKPRTSALDTAAPKKSTAPVVTGKEVINAHLPGLIIDILVKPGDTVKPGDMVIKMEAMKMVNEIRAKSGGVVREVFVSLQQNVMENQPLLVID